MPITRERQRKLREIALSITWQVLDAKSLDIDLCDALTDEEAMFVNRVIDSKAQRAYNEWRDCVDR